MSLVLVWSLVGFIVLVIIAYILLVYKFYNDLNKILIFHSESILKEFYDPVLDYYREKFKTLSFEEYKSYHMDIPTILMLNNEFFKKLYDIFEENGFVFAYEPDLTTNYTRIYFKQKDNG